MQRPRLIAVPDDPSLVSGRLEDIGRAGVLEIAYAETHYAAKSSRSNRHVATMVEASALGMDRSYVVISLKVG